MSSEIIEATAALADRAAPEPPNNSAAITTLLPGTHREGGEQTRPARELDAVYDIPVLVSAVLGRATMQVSQILKLGRGAVVELDRKVGDPIDVFVNNRLVARGEIVIIEGTRLGITMTEIVKSDRAG